MRICASSLASLLEEDLLEAGWDGSTDPYHDISVRQFSMQHLRRSLLKKYQEGSVSVSIEATNAAIAKFTEVNDACRTFVSQTSQLPDVERVAIGEAKSFLYYFFFPKPNHQSRWSGHDFILAQQEIAARFGVGPGASVGCKSTDLYSKLCLSTLDATDPSLYALYVQATSCNPSWAEMEICRFRDFGFKVCASSRLSVVPKYTDIGRVICTEPLLNMLFQKGIGSVIAERLKQVCSIDLTTQQSVNRHLAREGSITGRFGTIDLTSASDSLCRAIVREFFPAEVVNWLERTSCRSTVLPDGTKLDLHMISSMGNGFTFPLQTVFFTSLVYGAYKSLGIPFIRTLCPKEGNFYPFEEPVSGRYGNFAVNGDDIIVVDEAYDLVCRLLVATGFTVNVGKSFNTGLFRESCGCDSFCGRDVRGVYLKQLSTPCDIYSAINRLNRWSAAHRIKLRRTIGFLNRKVRFLPIPYDEDDSYGVKVPLAMVHRVRHEKHTGGVYYRYMRPVPNKVRVDNCEVTRPNLPNWVLNPDGLKIAFVAGSIRDGFVGLRSINPKAEIRRRFSSRWDWIQVDHAERHGYREDWKTFTEVNLDNGNINPHSG